ncbi:MAG TPA: glycosyltransferase [Gemmatimonadales bacterium]|nr:glycosyltransferase [Gemmatimonadales bacterium]
MAHPPAEFGSGFRVMHVAAPGAVGGLESVVQTLLPALRLRGLEVALAAIGERETASLPLVGALRRAGVEVFPRDLPERAYLEEWRVLRELFRSWRPQLVHTHGYRADVVAGWAARSLGLPTAATVHGFTGGDWKNRFYELLQCRVLRQATFVVAVSGPLRERLVRSGVGVERIRVIRNAWSPSEPPLSRGEARAALGLPVSARVVGWVGRVQQEKGPDLMLQAFALLDQPDLVLSVIGDGRDRRRLEPLAARLAPGRVRWHGVLEGAARLYSAFDCFVLSSRTEGTPIALFEAIAAGVPVVATRVGGVPDVVGPDEAILVPPGDPGALAAGVRAVFADPGAASARARAARTRLEREFAPDPWADQYLEAYRAWGARGSDAA